LRTNSGAAIHKRNQSASGLSSYRLIDSPSTFRLSAAPSAIDHGTNAT
jgi:hypothetical protein